MDLCINTLFPDGDNCSNNGSLNITTIANYDDNKQKKEKSDPKILVKTIIDRKKKNIELYDEIYSICWNRIIKANEDGKTDLIFRINEKNNIHMEYDPLTCLILIRNKLWKQGLIAKVITNTQLFISWKNLEDAILKL